MRPVELHFAKRVQEHYVQVLSQYENRTQLPIGLLVLVDPVTADSSFNLRGRGRGQVHGGAAEAVRLQPQEQGLHVGAVAERGIGRGFVGGEQKPGDEGGRR